MKRNKNSFFSFLVKSYILLTFIMIISVIGISYGLRYKVKNILSEPRINELVDFASLISDNENNIKDDRRIKKLTGKNSFIQILDEDNKVLYESDKGKVGENFTYGEIKCIPNYYDQPYIEVQDYINNKGKKNTSLSITYYGDNSSYNDIYVVDEKLNLIFTNTNIDKKLFTKKEFEYLKGIYPKGYDIRKYEFKDKKKHDMTLLIYTPSFNEKIVDKVYKAKMEGLILFIIIYILLIIIFIIWLSYKVKRPLEILDNAIMEFKNGKRENYLNYEGPQEFKNICDSFNEMSQILYNSEKKRQILEEDKKKMLADISHDLKTPITVIKGYSKAICDNLVSKDEVDNYLMTIYRKADDLDELINTFHEYSKIEHPNYKFLLENSDICEYIRTYLAEKNEELYIAGVEIEADILEDTIYCNIDKFQLKRVFDNIISNSLKHNNKNLKILFKVEKFDDEVKVTIADNGRGIPSDMYEEIFRPFIVGEKSRTKKGSGLGLAISKKIITSHKGSIKLVSPRENYKTEFEIILPLSQ